MSDEPIEPIAPSLADLFAVERSRTHAAPGSRARVLARLTASIGAGGGTGSDGYGGGGDAPSASIPSLGLATRLWPIVGALAVGGAVGAALATALREPRIVYVDRVATVTAAAPPSELPPPSSPAPTALAPPTTNPSESKSASPTASAPDATLTRERMILDVARTALGRNDAANALEAVDRHQREFPRGQMAEEREAIAIQALVKLGRTQEAAVRGTRFRRRFPSSVLMPVVDAALPPLDGG